MTINAQSGPTASGRDVAKTIAGPIAAVGSSFYFRPETLEVGKQHGLDGYRYYFLGRGGSLGDVEPAVVQAAFGYFNPTLTARMWSSAKEHLAPRDAGRLYLDCAHRLGRRLFADVDGLDSFVDAAGALSGAIRPEGLPLFAALSAEPVPADLPAQAMHQAIALREARGSMHLLAVVASGLDPRIAHRISRPDDYVLFGWTDDPDVTDEQRRSLEHAESLTNDLMGQACETLDERRRTALIDGATVLEAAL